MCAVCWNVLWPSHEPETVSGNGAIAYQEDIGLMSFGGVTPEAIFLSSVDQPVSTETRRPLQNKIQKTTNDGQATITRVGEIPK